jgi:hypothetical protein
MVREDRTPSEANPVQSGLWKSKMKTPDLS